MDIVQINTVHGDKVVTNDQVIELIEKRGGQPLMDDVKKYIFDLFEKSGPAFQRRHRDFSKPNQSVRDYVRRSFMPFQKYKDEIEMLIFCNIFKGVIEPASSALVAQDLGIGNAQCFDITEACNGFSRALAIAYSFFNTGMINGKILILSCEMPCADDSPTYGCWSNLKTIEDVEYYFPSLTFGSHATFALLENSDNNSWKFDFRADNQLADKCMTPLHNFADYLPEKDVKGNINPFRRMHEWRFFDEMKNMGYKLGFLVKELAEKHEEDISKAACLFVHSHSKYFWIRKLNTTKLGERVFHMYPNYGNLASGTLPVAIFEKYGGTIPKGQNIAWISASGGIACSCITWTHQWKAGDRIQQQALSAGDAPGLKLELV